jgi:type IV fimbrial biogenesis protein FimT
MPTQRGYTLVELLMCTAMVGGLMVLSLPSMAKLLDRQRHEITRDALSSSLLNARHEALRFNHKVVVCNSEGGSCVSRKRWTGEVITFVDFNRNGQLDVQVDQQLTSYALPKDVDVYATRTKLVFLRDGSARGTNLTLKTCSAAGQGYTVVVANTGRIRNAKARCD